MSPSGFTALGLGEGNERQFEIILLALCLHHAFFGECSMPGYKGSLITVLHFLVREEDEINATGFVSSVFMGIDHLRSSGLSH